jgi:hypothetical protein
MDALAGRAAMAFGLAGIAIPLPPTLMIDGVAIRTLGGFAPFATGVIGIMLPFR